MFHFDLPLAIQHCESPADHMLIELARPFTINPQAISGEAWFDPLENAIHFRVRAFIEAVVAEEAQAALGERERYQRSGPPKGYRNGHPS